MKKQRKLKHRINFLRMSAIIIASLFLFSSIPDSLYAKRVAYSPQNEVFSCNFHNATIFDVFKYIEKNSKYVFVYSNDIISLLQNEVTINGTNISLKDVLDTALKNSDLSYKINGNQISVKRDNKAVKSSEKVSLKVSGRVVDNTNQPLIGVTIQEEGTNNIVSSDIDGNYTIYNVSSEESILKFSYVGFTSQAIIVNKRDIINVTMLVDSKQLEEVVVVGYGQQKRESVIGAISTIKPTLLQVNQTRSISNALAGQVAGVIAIQRNGEPGQDASDFWIRGISTFGAGSNPLILVDGIERDLNNISPEEIESFSILKDATATAVYGVRGANGVILIQTKRGQVGAPRITIKADYGVSAPTQLPKFVYGAEYMEAMNVASRFTSGVEMYSEEAMEATRLGTDPDFYPSVNWLDTVTDKFATNGRVSLDVNGGSERLRYSLVASYYGENGIIVTDPSVSYNSQDKLSRYNIRTNLDMNLTPSTILNVNIGGFIINTNKPGATPSSILASTFKYTPISFPIKYSNGQIPTFTSQVNPWAEATQTGYTSEYRNQLQSVFDVTQDIGKLWEPLQGLKAKVTFSFDAYNATSFIRKKSYTTYTASGRDSEGNLITDISNTGDTFLGFDKGTSGNRTMYLEGQISYGRKFNDQHQVNGLILYNMRNYVNAAASSAIYSLPYRTQGIAGRLSYSFKDTYFVEGNFGYNGSENFAKGKKWGFFPSVAVGWMVTNEPFMEPLKKVISKLKFRGSYGLVGNDQIGGRRFAYITTINSNTSGYGYGANGSVISGKGEGEFGNPNLSWETVKKANFGVELGLWNSAVLIQADVFKERREDIFMQRKTIPEIAGFTSMPWANFGVVENKGVDASLEVNKQFGEDFFLSVRGNFTYCSNKILEYDESEAMKKSSRSRTNHSIHQYYGMQAIGLFQEDDFLPDGSLKPEIPVHTFGNVQPGDIRYKDINNDGAINSYDILPIGKTYTPEVIFGFGFSTRYKNVDLSAFFQGATNYDRMIQGSMLIPGSGGGGMGNIYANWTDRWDPKNPSSDVFWPRLSTNTSSNNMRYSTWWLKDASFIRLKNFEVGYSLPKKLQRNIRMRDARLFFRGTNLFTWAAFDMWDPELSTSDGMVYPLLKVYTFGLQVSF